MATIVEFEVPITSANQNDESAGRITVDKSACPDLAAATQIPPGYVDSGDWVERLLPVGSKLQYLIDNVTLKEVDTLYVLPNGKAWSSNTCRSDSTTGGKGFLGSWAIVGIAGLVFYYLFTRKK